MITQRQGLGRTALLVYLGATLSAGCETMPVDSPGPRPVPVRSPSEDRLYQQGQAFDSTVAEGCVMGATVGALLGYLLAPRDKRGTYAVGGALAGGALGCGSGMWLAKSQQQYAMTEQELDAMASELRQQNTQLAGLVDSARQVIAADKAKIARIDKDLAAGRISLAEARTEMGSVDGNRQYLEQTLANLKREQSNWKQAAARVRQQPNQARAAEIDREVVRLERQVASLESELDSLVKRRRLSRVG